MRRGFTLVELLVVIALMILLAALLFPVFRSARQAVRRAQCVSQLKQIGTAVRLYVDDYDGMFPQGAYNSTGALIGWDVTWHNLLANYVRSYQPFVCPSVPAGYTYRTSYGVNAFVSCWLFGQREAIISLPADTLYATEKRNEDWPVFTPMQKGLPFWQPMDPRHQSKVNALFCDGHVATVFPNEFVIAQVTQ